MKRNFPEVFHKSRVRQIIDYPDQFNRVLNDLSPATLYAESWCDFDREIAVMVLRGRDDALDASVVNSEIGENSGLIAAYPTIFEPFASLISHIEEAKPAVPNSVS